MNTIQTSEFLDEENINHRTFVFLFLCLVPLLSFFFFILTINNLKLMLMKGTLLSNKKKKVKERVFSTLTNNTLP